MKDHSLGAFNKRHGAFSCDVHPSRLSQALMSPPADSNTMPPPMVEPQNTPEPTPSRWRNRRAQRLRWPIMLAVLVLALLIGVVVYLSGGRLETTDDASVQGAMISIAP